MNEIEKRSKNIFEDIKHKDERGEYWYARELMVALEYTNWRSFREVIARAREATRQSGAKAEYHFDEVLKMVSMGVGGTTERGIEDVKLTRFACYMIAQNGNPVKKPRIAEAQSYFAIQTRRQEIDDGRRRDLTRLARRREFSESDKRLSTSVMEAGVATRGLANIKNEGDKAFFGGKTSKEMREKLGTGSRPWANRAHNVVLAGKTLANEMTSANIENFGIVGYENILESNKDNNEAVRKTIREQQGLSPEDFPPAEDTEKISNRLKKGEEDDLLENKRDLPKA